MKKSAIVATLFFLSAVPSVWADRQPLNSKTQLGPAHSHSGKSSACGVKKGVSRTPAVHTANKALLIR